MRVKIVAWFFIPTAIILLAVAITNFLSYQRVTEDLVIERDQEVTRLSASQLSSKLDDFTQLLGGIARNTNLLHSDPNVRQQALQRAIGGLGQAVFDGGVVVVDRFGIVQTVEPPRPEILGHDWADRPYFRQILRTSGPVFSNINSDGTGAGEVVSLAVPILGSEGQLNGVLQGMFRLGAPAVSSFYGEIVKLRIAESGSAYLVDGNGRVIYHSNVDSIGADFSDIPVVRQVILGNTSAVRTQDSDGDAIVAAYSPVLGTPWGLVTEEDWSVLTSSSQGFQRLLMLLLALG
ncbi:MAG: cache domain-containing protein, partial [Ardenticatenaceae bacterium]